MYARDFYHFLREYSLIIEIEMFSLIRLYVEFSQKHILCAIRFVSYIRGNLHALII